MLGSIVYIMNQPRSIYLIDHSYYRPPERLRIPSHKFMEYSWLTGGFDESSLEFQRKILERSGDSRPRRLYISSHRALPWSQLGKRLRWSCLVQLTTSSIPLMLSLRILAC
ncbi:3-ketoacyl-CoA synthase 9 [Camellia lanceoleosa]|uniref:3-ketoacyl-CoA synthase 9 n=1 Tax=Camellia lanceoleosa TaxID=1840588 RepID=A0ACC0IHL0_9ERIC|nr:3-ketoacyl-CoA synthase 9 [Camellia lanceoleosa]